MKLLMVCLGNICRSPMAEGIFRARAAELFIEAEVDSAGTGGWHAGEHPDQRAVRTAAEHGVDISRLTARQFTVADFERFDRIYVMDKSNYRDVIALARSEAERSKVEMLLHVLEPGSFREVPDPWYGGMDGFKKVFRMLDDACLAVLDEIKNNRNI